MRRFHVILARIVKIVDRDHRGNADALRQRQGLLVQLVGVLEQEIEPRGFFSGVDLPWMQYQYFTGQPVERAEGYLIGKSSRWFRGDAITVTRYLVDDTPKSADQLPSKPRVLLSWLFDFVRPGLKNDVESLGDPLPGLYELLQLYRDLTQIAQRKLRQLRGLSKIGRRATPSEV